MSDNLMSERYQNLSDLKFFSTEFKSKSKSHAYDMALILHLNFYGFMHACFIKRVCNKILNFLD